MKLKDLTNTWFYSQPNPLLVLLPQIFIKGDAIVLLPFLLINLIVILINLKIGLIIFGVYFTVRHLGEMIYWLLQQFIDTKYRPFDFGLVKLDNKAIYIIYQCISIIFTSLGIYLTILTILYL